MKMMMDPNDLSPDRVGPPGAFVVANTTLATRTYGDCQVEFEPFIKDGRVGYTVRSVGQVEMRETYVYLNPSDSFDSASPDLFVYKGECNDPAVDEPEFFVSFPELVDD